MRCSSAGTTQALVNMAETEASNAEIAIIANMTNVEHYKDNDGDIQEPTNGGDTNNQHKLPPQNPTTEGRANITNI